MIQNNTATHLDAEIILVAKLKCWEQATPHSKQQLLTYPSSHLCKICLHNSQLQGWGYSSAGSVSGWHAGSGSFFLACMDFGRKVQQFIPHLCFLLFFF